MKPTARDPQGAHLPAGRSNQSCKLRPALIGNDFWAFPYVLYAQTESKWDSSQIKFTHTHTQTHARSHIPKHSSNYTSRQSRNGTNNRVWQEKKQDMNNEKNLKEIVVKTPAWRQKHGNHNLGLFRITKYSKIAFIEDSLLSSIHDQLTLIYGKGTTKKYMYKFIYMPCIYYH